MCPLSLSFYNRAATLLTNTFPFPLFTFASPLPPFLCPSFTGALALAWDDRTLITAAYLHALAHTAGSSLRLTLLYIMAVLALPEHLYEVRLQAHSRYGRLGAEKIGRVRVADCVLLLCPCAYWKYTTQPRHLHFNPQFDTITAGIPTLIKPWFGDQFFWAARVQKLGAGLRVPSLSSSDLAHALTKATSDRWVSFASLCLSNNYPIRFGLIFLVAVASVGLSVLCASGA